MLESRSSQLFWSNINIKKQTYGLTTKSLERTNNHKLKLSSINLKP